MAIVTKPMALDESIKTTESTSRNIADVLAQELSGIASAITGGDGKANKTDIATVESGSTASRAYSVGELVYVNGNLYKVITAIASGATFTVGTNIQSTNVSGTVKDALNKAGKYTKLWENPNPSSAFAPQSVTLLSSDYDFLLIDYCMSSSVSANYHMAQMCFKDNTGILDLAYGTGTTALNAYRLFSINGTSVYFDNCYWATSASSEIDNNRNIPTAIYGIKF